MAHVLVLSNVTHVKQGLHRGRSSVDAAQKGCRQESARIYTNPPLAAVTVALVRLSLLYLKMNNLVEVVLHSPPVRPARLSGNSPKGPLPTSQWIRSGQADTGLERFI
jgi:hypothetical protein